MDSRRRLKSLHLVNTYHPTSGGVRAVYDGLLAAANAAEREVRLVVPAAENGTEEVGRFGRIYRVKAPSAPAVDTRYRIIMPGSYLRQVPHGVRWILQKEQPDVVEICDKFSLFYVAGLLRKGWMPGVGRPTLIGASAERFDDNVGAVLAGGRLARLLANAYVRELYGPMFDYHLANSEYTADELRDALPPHRQRVVHVCPPGVGDDVFDAPADAALSRVRWRADAGAGTGAVLLLYAGRLSPEKNVGLLVDTLAALLATSRADEDYRLVVAGDGPMRVQLERDAQDRTPGRALFLGNVSDRVELRRLFHASDVFVHPNPREPFGIAPLEAMASGVPLVMPRAGGVLTYASDDTAWPSAPHPEAFADAVRRVMGDSEQRAARVARARVGAEGLRRSAMMRRLFALYDSLHAERLALGGEISELHPGGRGASRAGVGDREHRPLLEG